MRLCPLTLGKLTTSAEIVIFLNYEPRLRATCFFKRQVDNAVENYKL